MAVYTLATLSAVQLRNDILQDERSIPTFYCVPLY